MTTLLLPAGDTLLVDIEVFMGTETIDLTNVMLRWVTADLFDLTTGEGLELDPENPKIQTATFPDTAEWPPGVYETECKGRDQDDRVFRVFKGHLTVDSSLIGADVPEPGV